MNQSRRINILLVDDHPESLIALEAVLQNPGYNIVKAGSGEEALRHLLRTDFALILLDVQMPDLNGFDIARMIRQRKKNKHVPIIFVTGYGKEDQYIAEGYSAGAVDYMLKPIDPEILKAKVAFFTHLHAKNEALRHAGDKYREVIEAVHMIVWRADASDLRLSFVSEEAEKLLKVSTTAEFVGSNSFWNRIHPDDAEEVLERFRNASGNGEPFEAEYRLQKNDSTFVWFQNMVHPVVRDGAIIEFIGIMLDITERKNAEEAILKANEELEDKVRLRTAELERAKEAALHAEHRFRELVEGLDGIVWEAMAPSMNFLFVSKQTETILGYEVDRWLCEPDFWRSIIEPSDREMVTGVLTGIGSDDPDQKRLEYRVVTADGRVLWLSNSIRTIQQINGERRLQGIMIDVTDRKNKERIIQASLHEKEMLLKEIHHRVKNNLQIVYSLLNLQKSQAKNTGSWEILNESQNRLRAMALIHEKLYETSNLAQIEFADYIRDLAGYLLRSYGMAPEKVKLIVESAGVSLNIDTAIPCGLIIHELVSNALKYAFPDGRVGEIKIHLQPEEDSYRLIVSDNGVGFPEDLDFRAAGSLGMKLVHTLTSQLEGTVDMQNSGGTTFHIKFAQLRQHARAH